MPGRQYYGQGSSQLSWNYNYGAFSKAMFGDVNILLERPELVATTWLNFASVLWFFMTPEPPKPSMVQVRKKRKVITAHCPDFRYGTWSTG